MGSASRTSCRGPSRPGCAVDGSPPVAGSSCQPHWGTTWTRAQGGSRTRSVQVACVKPHPLAGAVDAPRLSHTGRPRALCVVLSLIATPRLASQRGRGRPSYARNCPSSSADPEALCDHSSELRTPSSQVATPRVINSSKRSSFDMSTPPAKQDHHRERGGVSRRRSAKRGDYI